MKRRRCRSYRYPDLGSSSNGLKPCPHPSSSSSIENLEFLRAPELEKAPRKTGMDFCPYPICKQ
ncbi:hypothetical protein STEG23_022044, partial [Scotinomys teguina]